MSVIDIELFKRKIIAKADEEWVNNVNNKPKLRLYTTFKNIRKAEDYVTSGFPRYNRSLMAQLRSGTLPLAIEVGRYRGLAVEDRICTVCNLNITESELHFILECPAYTRSSMDDILLQYDTINMTANDKLKILMNHHKDFSNALLDLWMQRKSKMFS